MFSFVHFSLYSRRDNRKRPHQISGDEGSDDEAHVDVDGMTAMLSDLSQTRQRRRDGEGEDEDGFEQLGAVGDGRVKIHLRRERDTREGSQTKTTDDSSSCSLSVTRL